MLRQAAVYAVKKITARQDPSTWHHALCMTGLRLLGNPVPIVEKDYITLIGCVSKEGQYHSAEPTLRLFALLHLIKKTNITPDL